uniref:Uncharacterized protein n=1 Tax=Timema poppense TaxID=170557 RepID=A0A7R9H1N3_TIMPO|nr:unnamed protein product [Timema poppensis]
MEKANPSVSLMAVLSNSLQNYLIAYVSDDFYISITDSALSKEWIMTPSTGRIVDSSVVEILLTKPNILGGHGTLTGLLNFFRSFHHVLLLPLSRTWTKL